MAWQPTSPPAAVPAAEQEVLAREAGLHRNLTARQLSMISIGGAIGTGLFLGSAISVRLAGPGVILSYVAGAAIALTLMWALGEMAVARPVAGSFGVYAEMYIHRWAGFVVRYTYWLCQVVAIGSEVVAAAIFCGLWFPGIPQWIWIAAFSAGMIYVNARSVASFGAFEYWFAMIKVVTITIFLILGGALLFGVGFHPLGAANYTAHGGFLPHGWLGVGLGVTMAIFSYLGLEVVGATVGEAANPRVAVPRALRRTLLYLVLFYVGSLGLVVGLVPWNQVGLGESPFVYVLRTVGIRRAADVMNFVVLTAALSSALCNLYFTSRLLFSLARGGYAPAALGRLNKRGMPALAALASSAGMVAAVLLSRALQDTAFVFMIGVAFFGGPFIWIMILATHLAFRRAVARGPHPPPRFAPPGPWSSLFGLAALIAVLVSTWWIPAFHITLLTGPPWLAFISLCYWIWTRANRRPSSAG